MGNSPFYKWCCYNWISTLKRIKLEHYITLYTKINSKWIKDLNIRPETIKLLEENIWVLEMISLDMTLKAQATKPKINKWNHIKLKKLLHSERNDQQNEDNL